jgi:tetratricopeptide (TPR) repeat protein
MSAAPDYYEVLQVSPTSDREVIRAAYNRLVEKWHTERTPGDPSAFGQLSLLDEAYAALSDPQKRHEYDSRRRQPAICGAVGEESSLATTSRQQDVVSAAWGSGPYTQQRATADRGYRREVSGPAEQPGGSSQASDANPSKGTVSTAAWVLFTVGAILFGVAHGKELFVRPDAFLLRCVVWGLFFGIPVCLDLRRKYRTSMTIIATLFCLAAGLDAASPFITRVILGPSTEVAQTRVEVSQPQTSGDRNPDPIGDSDKGVGRFRETDALAYVESGRAWVKKKEYDKAIGDLTEAIRLDPNDGLAYSERGFVWLHKGNYDGTISDFTEAIRLDERLKSVLCGWRGEAWRMKKDYKNAIQDCDESIRLRPTFKTYSCRGYAKMGLGDYAGAITDFDEAIRLDPNKMDSFVGRGFAWTGKKDHDKAIRDFDEAIRLDQSHARSFVGRGFAWSGKQDYDKAIRDFDEAIRLDPNNSSAREGRSLTLEEQKVQLARRNLADLQSRNQRRGKLILESIEELDPKIRIYSFKDDWRRFTNPYRVNKISTEWERDKFVQFLVEMEQNEQAERRQLERYARDQGMTQEEWRRSKNYPLPEDHKSGAWKRLRENLIALEYR